ncbi:MAG: endopeptidase La [Spirochaetales bacterium]|nr:endopeptidase La [Spirochaetales bacterium]
MKINKIDNTIPSNGNEKLPLIPLREMVPFPFTIKNFYVGRKDSILAIECAIEKYERKILLVTQKIADDENPNLEDLYEIGVLASVVDVKVEDSKNAIRVTVEVEEAITITSIELFDGVRFADFNLCGKISPGDEQKVRILKKLILKDLQTFLEMSHGNLQLLEKMRFATSNIEFFNLGMSVLIADIKSQIEILKSNSLDSYFSKLAVLIYQNIENVNLEKKIMLSVHKKLNKNQKDFFLNEQIKEIQKELSSEGKDLELLNTEEFNKRLEAAEMPLVIKERLLKEQKRLSGMPSMAQEAVILKSYIETFFELPWVSSAHDNHDLAKAKEILDSHHYSLKKAKNRILEYLAVRQLNPKTKGPILCFVGPPGTGKTTLSHSVADALGREFIRVSLGGVRDEAEIRGHRRTYLGALPGKIIQSMKRVKSRNPVFLLDEIDKMSSDFRGDPASALLEVLDPEQNCQFVDHFMEVPYDLSDVMFLCTANSLRGIPYPLLDRLEVIQINSYMEKEKLHIAKDFIIPKEKKENGIDNIDLHFSSKAIISIIRHYTMESGVRSLERQIASICRKTAKKIVLDTKSVNNETIKITTGNLKKYLGEKKFVEPSPNDFLDVGVSNGLAWSELGGSILPIEIVLYAGKGNITLTGKLGDVMKESAQTAFSFIKSTAELYQIKFKDFYKEYDLHIHFPEGATPKDGPSGGLAISCGILSALTKTPIRSTIAMTGEITLTGRVLAIGGLREKVLAALRHGKKEVVIPEANIKDLNDLPKNVRDAITFKPVKRAEEAFHFVFEHGVYVNE